MPRLVILGNSGSGKSTLAGRLAGAGGLAHLDLDTRAWEPHKYASKEAKDANLDMLTDWIRKYESRTDEFSLAAHRALFDGFTGEKIELTSLESILAFSG